MKKKTFIIFTIVLILLMTLTFVLQTFFYENTGVFGLSCGMFFISIFPLVCYKNALIPPGQGVFGAINTTKAQYAKKGKLHEYQKLCRILFIIVICIAFLLLLSGIIELCLILIKSMFNK